MELFCVLLTLIFLSSDTAANELDKPRSKDNFDLCKPNEASNDINSFREQISDWAEYYSTNSVPLELDDIYSIYQVKDGFSELSLKDLNYCELDQSSLSRSLKNVPDQKTINSLNHFFYNSKQVNYDKLFSCLATEESLGDPDTQASQKVYRESTGGASKPSGVKFYIDREQPKESALNIGLFQFTPNVNGNIQSCVKSWNKIFQGKNNCQIKNNKDALSALSSSAQNFNAFCGIHKIIETAAIQMKSEKTSAKFRPGSECVSLQMRAGLAYNHFGPLQNSTGKNLASLGRCLDSEQL
jgi:hypothetical protein